jgi:GNAT superfamily N-acetyltransferase
VTDAELYARMLDGMAAFFVAAARSSNGGAAVERDGVAAAIVPAAPDRSLPNSVVYTRPDSLASALEELAQAYEERGVRAWTVWVPEQDRATAELLERAGHRLDGEPRAMGCELATLDVEPARDVDVEEGTPLREIARLNDQVYGLAGDLERSFSSLLAEGARTYAVRREGKVAASTVTLDHGGDCGVYLVATSPEARGAGLATALLTRALLDARERGCETSTLQATRIGRPLYARLGYRDLGAVEMWERRPAA